jgi:5-methylphenazine-1-carboxylate 1-monooxygenase
VRAVVVGAGIGGLTTALCLHQHGIAVDVFEQSDAVRELGVGLNVLPPAVAELAGLGLLRRLDDVAVRTGTLIMTNRRGQEILSDPRGLAAGAPAPQFSIHRGRLQRVLLDALRHRAGASTVRVDRRFDRFEQDDCEVRAFFVDRSGAPAATVDGDVLIGADGIRSSVREQLVPAEGEPLWNGSILWRGAAEWPVFLDGRTMIIAGGNAAKLVVYPIAPGRDATTRLTNWGVVAGGVAPPGRTPPRPATHWDIWSQPGRRDELMPYLARFSSRLVDVHGLVAATKPIYEYPMCDREPLTRWSHGRVTLLGDAAHPMYPMGSNGATQAIIDAAAVASRLAACGCADDVPGALRAYERDRREVTNRLVLMNRTGGPERLIDLVEKLAPGGFADITEVMPIDDLRRVVAEYAAMGSPVRS